MTSIKNMISEEIKQLANHIINNPLDPKGDAKKRELGKMLRDIEHPHGDLFFEMSSGWIRRNFEEVSFQWLNKMIYGLSYDTNFDIEFDADYSST